MRRIIAAMVAVATISVGLATGAPPASAAATPIDLANAIVGSGITVTAASFTTGGFPDAVQVRSDVVAGFPVTAGGSYAVLSTGDALDLTTPDTSGSLSTSHAAPQFRTTYDATTLKIDFTVQPGFNCLASLRLRFLSEEFPEFVGTAFNDAVLVELDGNDWSVTGANDVVAPNNIAFVGTSPITVNNSGPLAAVPGEAAGTTFDAATPILSARSPITPGPHSLFITIFDQGDPIYDSTVLIDDLRASTVVDPNAECPRGAFSTQVNPPNRFVPITPARVIDTRGPAPLGLPGLLAATTSTPFQITGKGGLPANGVSGVVLNLTATETSGAGFVRVTPSGSTSNVSNLNVEFAGQTLPNLVTVPVSADGKIDFFSQSATHLVVDVFGYYTQAASATAGRLIPVDPTRVLDTREANGVPTTTRVPSGGVVDLQIAGRGQVPATGAAAVVLTVTVTESTAAGFVTVWPSGTSQPNTSNLNVVRPNQTIPNQVIVPLGTGGRVSLFTQNAAHLIADVAGYFTDASAPLSTTGLFIPVTPSRVLDTREANGVAGTSRPGPGATVSPDVAGRGGVPASGVSAIVGNTTATESINPGFVTVFPRGIAQPNVSNLNLERPNQTIANHTTVRLNNGGISLFTQEGAHLLFDVAGFYTS